MCMNLFHGINKFIHIYKGIRYNKPIFSIIQRDIIRTRIVEFKSKEELMKETEQILGFYCLNENVKYQQGMHEIAFAVILLKNDNKFKLEHAYAYFKGILENYIPHILHSKYTKDGQGLPHLACYLKLTSAMLRFHDIELWKHLEFFDVYIELFATPWIMTFFSRAMPLELLYEFWDIYLLERDRLFLFYIIIALLVIKRDKILQKREMGHLLCYLSKEMRITSLKELGALYQIAVHIRASTPKSFGILISKLGLFDRKQLHSSEELDYVENILSITRLQIFPADLDSLRGRAEETTKIYNPLIKNAINNSMAYIYTTKELDCPEDYINLFSGKLEEQKSLFYSCLLPSSPKDLQDEHLSTKQSSFAYISAQQEISEEYKSGMRIINNLKYSYNEGNYNEKKWVIFCPSSCAISPSDTQFATFVKVPAKVYIYIYIYYLYINIIENNEVL